jgi:hypothetical protein
MFPPQDETRDCVPRRKSGRMDGEMRRPEHPTVVILLAVVSIIGIGAGDNPFRNPFRVPPCTVPVLLAGRMIPQGTPGDFIVKSIPQGTSGDAIVKRHMYLATRLWCGQRKYGAIVDPQDIAGTTVAELLPGQQLTKTDFTPRWSPR